LIQWEKNSFGSNNEPVGDGGKIRPETIANISKQHLKETTATNLGEVSAIGNPPLWQPAPYQGQAADAAVEQPETHRMSLRAHLISAVNTAVKTPVIAVVEYNYEQDGSILIPAGASSRERYIV
jgi:hypothetical protein